MELFPKIHVGPVNVQSKQNSRRGIKTVRTVLINKPTNVGQLNKMSGTRLSSRAFIGSFGGDRKPRAANWNNAGTCNLPRAFVAK